MKFLHKIKKFVFIHKTYTRRIFLSSRRFKVNIFRHVFSFQIQNKNNMPPLQLVDVAGEDFEEYEKAMEETNDKKIEKTRSAKVAGASVGVIVLGVTAKDIVTPFGKSTRSSYQTLIVKPFEPTDFPEGTGNVIDREQARVARLSSRRLSDEEVEVYKNEKKISGNQRYSPPAVEGYERIFLHQHLEVFTFQKWKCNGRNAGYGDYVLLTNLRHESKTGGNSDVTGWACENTTTYRPTQFEKIQLLNYIAPYFTNFVPLSQTDDDRDIEFPSRITEHLAALTPSSSSWVRQRLEEDQRKHQSRPEQLRLMESGICIPFAANPDLGTKFGRLYFDLKPTIEHQAAKEKEDPEKAYCIVSGNSGVIQISNNNGKKERSRIGIHISFSPASINQLGLTNEMQKPFYLSQMLSTIKEGVMWCTVEIMPSTRNCTDVPTDPDGMPVFDWQIFLRCQSVFVDHEKLIKQMCLPITLEYAKILFRNEIQKQQREYFAPRSLMKLGDRVYNASECTSSPEEDYNYYILFRGLDDMTMHRVNEIFTNNGLNLEQQQIEISNALQGKNKIFESCFKKLVITDKTNNPVLWGISKKAEKYPEPPPVNELVRNYNAWLDGSAKTAIAPAPEPQQAPNPDPHPIEGKKRKAGNDNPSKRVKKEQAFAMED